MVRKFFAVIWLVVFGYTQSCWAFGAQTVPTTTITPSFFGIHIIDVTSHWPPFNFGSLAKGNCVQWIYIQPHSTSSYNWSALDTYVNAATAHGTTFTYAIGTLGIPDWATSDPSTCNPPSCGGPTQQCGAPPTTGHEVDFKNFFTALATRYCTKMSYELWNEPWTVDAGQPNMTPAQLVNQTKDEETAIRAGCPNAVILTPSFGGDTNQVAYMQSYFDDGAPTDVNVISLHSYTNGSDPVDFPESTNPITGHGILYGNVIPILTKYLIGKPIWMTEGSWGENNGSLGFQTAAQQAAYVARYFLIEWSVGFQRTDWYEYDNSAWGPLYPPVRGDHSALPQTAYGQIYNWMVGKQMTQPCIWMSDHITWTCGFTGPQGYKSLAVWRTSGSSSFTPPNSSQWTQYRDLTGTIHTYSGSGSVPITISPILLENCVRH